jgi:hypothetical protein
LSCQLGNVTLSSEVANQLHTVTAERDRLKSEREELAEQVRSLHLQLEGVQQDIGTSKESSYSQALEILHSALSLKANVSGTIKVEIKRALEKLAPSPVDSDTESN